MNDTLKEISDIGIVPVIAIEDAVLAVPLARALKRGGLPAAEVTFRTAAAEDAIRAIASEAPDMLLGAGTVTTREQVDRALAAGCRFIVSPGFNPEIVRYALAKGALMIPGTATAGEMEQAMALGLDVVKFFPAEASGGVAMLRALAGPYRRLRWLPTGGVNARNLMDYLGFDRVLACGGTWMVRRELIEGRQWAEIEAATRDAVRLMLGFELRRVALNCAGPEEARETARRVCAIFGFDCETGDAGTRAGDRLEYLSQPGRGTLGRIDIATNSPSRAVYHLTRRGVAFDASSAVCDPKGNLSSIYLRDELGGFAFRLVQK